MPSNSTNMPSGKNFGHNGHPLHVLGKTPSRTLHVQLCLGPLADQDSVWGTADLENSSCGPQGNDPSVPGGGGGQQVYPFLCFILFWGLVFCHLMLFCIIPIQESRHVTPNKLIRRDFNEHRETFTYTLHINIDDTEPRTMRTKDLVYIHREW